MLIRYEKLKPEDTHYFTLLKQAISHTFLASHSAPAAIGEWKGDTIIAFQEDLRDNVKASISEKWFYTYIKNTPEKLPRIDMLNMLSRYVGFDNWQAFKNAHTATVKKGKKGSSFKKFFWFFLLILILATAKYIFSTKNTFEFCFVDEDKYEMVPTVLDIKILQNDESPIYLKTDSLGCFSYTTKEKIVQFVVQSPYYKTDTIIRTIDAHTNRVIKLHTDDYALMLYYYSNGKVNDWKKRRRQLKNLIADNAKIYQVFSHAIGVEVYSKDEFINKLTTPTSSLQKIKIVDKSLQNGKIVTLKFMIP